MTLHVADTEDFYVHHDVLINGTELAWVVDETYIPKEYGARVGKWRRGLPLQLLQLLQLTAGSSGRVSPAPARQAVQGRH